MGSPQPHNPATSRTQRRGSSKPSRSSVASTRLAALVMISSTASFAMAQADGGCVSLKGSTTCPSFDSASISTNQTLVDYYPFLQYVSDVDSFDNQMMDYVKTDYVRDHYQNTLGCSDIDFSNTSDLYARYTITTICNGIVQNSIDPCKLSDEQARPVCADTCAEFAQSEAYLTSDDSICSNPTDDLSNLVRADFITCSLPEDALTDSCIAGSDNESTNCGYGNSTVGFCSYCGSGGINSTDTCCYNANAEDRCKGVNLPKITQTMTFSTPLPTATSTKTSSSSSSTSTSDDSSGGSKDDDGDDGLSGGAIAGIVVGSVAGVILIALLLFFCIRRTKRRSGSQQGSILNQPSPARAGPSMSMSKAQGAPQGYEVLPGGRIARMSALEGHSGDSPTHHHGSSIAGGTTRRKGSTTQSSSDGFVDAPEPETRAGVLRPPPTNPRRRGSLSSSSVLNSSDPQSPSSAGGFSSPQAVASQQSEQLPFFKDYYSEDDIHPSDRVAVLWAYQPRAADEFALERGDMLKIVGIWDDGWATGIMCDERFEDWEMRRQAQRDSGVSNTSGRQDSPPDASGEIKAFPLVCVCLPEHWRKTIEGDGSTESGSNGHPMGLS